MKKVLTFIISILLVLLLASCNARKQFEYDNTKINVVVTTTVINDVAINLGRDLVNVYPIMGTGVDPHSYIGRPSDTSALKQADLIIYNGLDLEANLILIINSFPDTKVLNMGSYYPEDKLLRDENGAIDPHIWFDLENFQLPMRSITNKFIEIDSSNNDLYEEYYNEYLLEVNDVMQEINLIVDELPVEKRFLISAHDAFQYFGRAYQFEVHAIQGISTASEASPRDIQDLANLVVEKEVKAIFLETSIPYHTIQSVINAVNVQGWNVVIGGELYSDSLGSEEGTNTYLGMIKHNIEVIVTSLK